MFPNDGPEPAVHRDADGSILWVESSGRYLLTSENTESMFFSLRNHLCDLQAMGAAEVARLERWHNFCAAHPDFCVVYQIDY